MREPASRLWRTGAIKAEWSQWIWEVGCTTGKCSQNATGQETATPQTIRGNAGGTEKQYTCWLDFGASDERNSRLQSSLVGVTSLVAGRA